MRAGIGAGVLMLCSLIHDARAQGVAVEPVAAAPAATAAQAAAFAVTNAAGDTLFLVRPDHVIRMGQPGSATITVGPSALQLVRQTGTGSGIWGIVENAQSGFYGVRGETIGTGAGVLGISRQGGAGAIGVLGVTYGGASASAGVPAIGVNGRGLGDGAIGGIFSTNSARNLSPALIAEYTGSNPENVAFIARRYTAAPNGTIALFGTGRFGSPEERYVVRISDQGNIFTEGNIHARGKITSDGGDFAERFAVVGGPSGYTPGDVLEVSDEADRHLERSSTPYSTRIAGVYATKPGLVLGLGNADEADSVPVGVLGVVPTKVTDEGGPIRRGDLLVSSSTPGHAMKGDPDRLRIGTVLGRALQDFTAGGAGLIEVLVNVK